MTTIEVIRTYLRHDGPAPLVTACPLDGAILEQAAPCPAALYLWLYRETGRDYHWVDRLGWSESATAAYLAESGREIWILRAGPVPQGWFELGPGTAPDHRELVYFGLLPWAAGRTSGLGRWLLEATLRVAFSGGATALEVNTCTLDHPAALPNYHARGFRTTHEETYTVVRP